MPCGRSQTQAASDNIGCIMLAARTRCQGYTANRNFVTERHAPATAVVPLSRGEESSHLGAASGPDVFAINYELSQQIYNHRI